MHYKDLAKYITGISTPIFGISWQPLTSERESIRRLIVYLEDRRVLYPYTVVKNEPLRGAHAKHPEWAIESIQEIRQEITKTLSQCEFPEEAEKTLQNMRRACRQYLDVPLAPSRIYERKLPKSLYMRTIDALRDNFAQNIVLLCSMYGIDLGEELSLLVSNHSSREQLL